MGGGARSAGAAAEFQEMPQAVADADEGGIAGTGEELAQTLEKVVS